MTSHAQPEVPIGRRGKSGIKATDDVKDPPGKDGAASSTTDHGFLHDEIPIDIPRSTLQYQSGQFVAIGVYFHDPDGNGLEFFVEAFADQAEGLQYIRDHGGSAKPLRLPEVKAKAKV